jgi:phage shock protein C
MVKKKERVIDVESDSDVRKIYRSKEDRMIGGVCGGIAEYANIDTVWVRLIAVLLIFFDGVGILIYIILWILIPDNPYQEFPDKKKGNSNKDSKESNHEQYVKKERKSKDSGSLIIGGLLIIIGLLFFLRQFFSWVSFNYMWPLILIGVGLVLLMRR